MRKRTRARVMSFGLSPIADVRASDISSNWPNRLSLTVTYRNESQKIQTRFVGGVLGDFGSGRRHLRHCLRTRLADVRQGHRHGRAQPGAIFRAPCSGGRPSSSIHKAPVGPFPLFRFSQKRHRSAQDGDFREHLRLCRIGGRANAVPREKRSKSPTASYSSVPIPGTSRSFAKGTREKILAFRTAFEASAYFKEHVLPDELIVLKGSLRVDHLERIMLSLSEPVVCWMEHCRVKVVCSKCADYRRSHPAITQLESPIEDAAEPGERPLRWLRPGPGRALSTKGQAEPLAVGAVRDQVRPMYAVKEIYYTAQGEGMQTGRAAVFCRFAGCNLWSGREADRAEAVCNFCDTDFVGTDGPGGGRFADAASLARACRAAWRGNSGTRPYIVLTAANRCCKSMRRSSRRFMPKVSKSPSRRTARCRCRARLTGFA